MLASLMEAASHSGPEPPEIPRALPSPGQKDASQDLAPSSGGGGTSLADEYKLALDVLTGLANQELDRANSYGTRARQAFAFAAGFFAVVQTVAFNSFAGKFVGGHERHFLLVLAIAAGVALAVCGIALIFADSTRGTYDLTSDEVLATLNHAIEADEPVAAEFAALYAAIVDERRATNERRRRWLRSTQGLALASAGIVLWELIYALNARIG